MPKDRSSQDDAFCLIENDGCIRSFSDSFLDIFGLTLQQVYSLTIFDILPDFDWLQSMTGQNFRKSDDHTVVSLRRIDLRSTGNPLQLLQINLLANPANQDVSPLTQLLNLLNQCNSLEELASTVLNHLTSQYDLQASVFYSFEPNLGQVASIDPELITHLIPEQLADLDEEDLVQCRQDISDEGTHLITIPVPCRGTLASLIYGVTANPLSQEKWSTLAEIQGLLVMAVSRIRHQLKAVAELRERQRTQSEQRQGEHRFKQFLSTTSEGIFRIHFDPPLNLEDSDNELSRAISVNGKIVESNESAARIFGFELAKDLANISPSQFFSEPQLLEMVKNATVNNQQREKLDTEARDKHGRTLWTRNSYISIFEQGRLSSIWCTVQDITHQQQYRALIESGSHDDTLTRLPNRVGLMHFLDTKIEANANLALILIDLDNFRDINDALGHNFGDLVLKEIGPRLQSLGQESFIARLGGDEFAVVVEDLTDDHQIETLAYSILAALRSPYSVHQVPIELDASLGIATYPKHSTNRSELLRHAEVAMYRAKQSTFKVLSYDPEHEHRPKQRLSVLSGLKSAIHNQEFKLIYQPQVAMEDRELKGFECLLRWNRSDNEILPPGYFIPLAEMSHHIHDITRWVIGQCFADMAEWKSQGKLWPVSINLSSKNLMDTRLVNYLSQQCLNFDIPPNYVVIELTESAVMSDTNRAISLLKKLRSEGFGISIDDFGTGYSSLTYLKILPVNALKIDKEFIGQIGKNLVDTTIVKSIISLAHNLNIEVVAEGVETMAVWNILTRLGCDYAQGYFISRGIDSVDVPQFAHHLENLELTS